MKKKKHKEERRSPYCTKHFVLWSTTSHASIPKVGGKETFYRLSLKKTATLPVVSGAAAQHEAGI